MSLFQNVNLYFVQEEKNSIEGSVYFYKNNEKNDNLIILCRKILPYSPTILPLGRFPEVAGRG